MEDNLGNVIRAEFESIWKLWRGGEQVDVDEKDLTSEEVRLLRCNELLQEFDVQSLHNEIVDIQREIIVREARLARMDAFKGGAGFVNKLRHKVAGAMTGKTPASELTDKEARTLETVYVRTLPFAALSPGKEATMRAQIRKVATADFESGTFQTINDALRHYGLNAEVEE